MSIAETRERTAEIVERRRLARRAVTFGPSVWGEAGGLVQRYEDVIYFGSGAPARELYPILGLQDAAERAWAGAADALDYGDAAGYGPLRESIVRRMAAQGIVADPNHLMITNGSQQGLDYVARMMLDPGDAVIVEGPTYIGALQAFDAYEPEYVVIPVDDQGMDIAEMGRVLDRMEKTPKFVYTIPTFQNPSGITMSGERRDALLALCRERRIMVLEDDPYGEVYFGDPPPSALRARDSDVIYLGTFSKTIAPGIRVGWLVAPPDLIDLFLIEKEAADLHGDRLIMRTVYHASEGFLDEHVALARGMYRARRDALLASLDEHMPPGVTWSRPDGGFFVWLTLPDGASDTDLLPHAAARGVAFLPGAWFYPRGHERHDSLRLNFSTLPEARIHEGIRRLGRVIADVLAGR